MLYYLVNAIGSGTKKDPFRPDIPTGISFVGITKDGQYLIGVNEELPYSESRQLLQTDKEIEATAISMGYTLADVKSWYVSG